MQGRSKGDRGIFIDQRHPIGGSYSSDWEGQPLPEAAHCLLAALILPGSV